MAPCCFTAALLAAHWWPTRSPSPHSPQWLCHRHAHHHHKRVSNTSGIATVLGGYNAITCSIDFVLCCVKDSSSSTMCYRTLLEATKNGGLMCLCDIAMTPVVMTSGYSAEAFWLHTLRVGGHLLVDSMLSASAAQYHNFLIKQWLKETI
jgi:hypothetical protein